MVRTANSYDSTSSCLDDQIVWQEVTRLARTALRDAGAGTNVPRARDRLRAESRSGDAWELRAQPLLHAGDGQPVVVVAVERVAAATPTVAEVRDRFGLSPRQAQVAVLLARRLTTKEIAAALRISRHTARRHVELVLIRLRVHSRTEVAELLMETPAPRRERPNRRRASGGGGDD